MTLPDTNAGSFDANRSITPPALPGRRSSGTRLGCGSWAAIGMALLLLIGLFLVFGIVSTVGDATWTSGGGELREVIIEGDPQAAEKIVVIDIKGIILPDAGFSGVSPQQVLKQLRAAAEDPEVVGVILDMNTPGGEVTASDEIHRGVRQVSAQGKPVVTVIRSVGASGGYLIAAGSDHIIANRMSITGSIGVIMSTINIAGFLAKHDIEVEVYASGRMKDMLSSTKARSPEEKAYVDALVHAMFMEFAQIVADGREGYESAEAVAQAGFGDGRILTGEVAYSEFGLVDELGYFEDGIARARGLAASQNAKVVRYQLSAGLSELLFNLESRYDPAAKLLPAYLGRLQAGQMYFLAPTAVKVAN